jgi:hypothetical protein
MSWKRKTEPTHWLMQRTNTPTVCILYGFCEGRRIGKDFEHELLLNGFCITRNVAQADIIVAHSGGCFAVPKNCQAKLVIFIGLPFWPGKSMLGTLRQKIWLDVRTSRNRMPQILRKTTWHLIYFWNMVNNWRMLEGKRSRAWEHSSTTTVLIRNRYDAMCTANIRALHGDDSPILLSMEGQHDDCWTDTGTYLAIIKAYYGRLLAKTN